MASNITFASANTFDRTSNASNDIALTFESSLQKQQPSISGNTMESQNRFGIRRQSTSSTRSVTQSIRTGESREIGQAIAIGATLIGMLGFIGTLSSMPAWMPGEEGGRKKKSL